MASESQSKSRLLQARRGVVVALLICQCAFLRTASANEPYLAKNIDPTGLSAPIYLIKVGDRPLDAIALRESTDLPTPVEEFGGRGLQSAVAVMQA